MTVTTKFPKRLKYTKDNPYQDFYLKCIKSANIDYKEGTKIRVESFKINPSDREFLKKYVLKHLHIQNPWLSEKELESGFAWLDLDIGPSLSSQVKIGTVQINTDELYED